MEATAAGVAAIKKIPMPPLAKAAILTVSVGLSVKKSNVGLNGMLRAAQTMF